MNKRPSQTSNVASGSLSASSQLSMVQYTSAYKLATFMQIFGKVILATNDWHYWLV